MEYQTGLKSAEVIEELKKHGISITIRTLQRYVKQNLIAPPFFRKGQGRGVFTLYPHAVVNELLELKQPEATSLRAAVKLTEKAHLLCIEERMAAQEEADRLRASLERVQSVGHNLDCLFCGFKDKEVLKALKGE